MIKLSFISFLRFGEVATALLAGGWPQRELAVEVRNLAGLSQTKIVCRELGIVRATWLKVRAVFELHSAALIPEQRLQRLIRVHPKRFELVEKDGSRRFVARFLPTEAERPFRFLRWVLAQLSRD